MTFNGKCQSKKEVVQAVSGVAADKAANGTVMPIPERHSFVPATRFPTTVVPCATPDEHAHLVSDIEKLPIWGSLFPFWSPTGDLVCQLETTST